MIRWRSHPWPCLPSLQRKIVTDQAAYNIFFVDEAIRAVTDGVQGSCVGRSACLFLFVLLRSGDDVHLQCMLDDEFRTWRSL